MTNKEREQLAGQILVAMITSPAVVDRATVSERLWARKAVRFVCALEAELAMIRKTAERNKQLNKWAAQEKKNPCLIY